MNEIQKNIVVTIVIAAIVSFSVVLFLRPTFDQFGGKTEGYWDSAGGYYVDGTAIIDGDGNVDGAITSGSASTFASTVEVTGALSGLSTLIMTGETNVTSFIHGDADGAAFATSTKTAGTLTAANICDNSIIVVTPLLATTLTLPATSTLYADCLLAIGDTKEILIENATTSAGSLTIAAGTGITLLEPSGGDVVIAYNEWATLRFTRVSGMECAVVVTSIQDAD